MQTPPRAGPLAKLQMKVPPGVKDSLPIARTPRKQKSSRFAVPQKVELQRLPGFFGASAPRDQNRETLTQAVGMAQT